MLGYHHLTKRNDIYNVMLYILSKTGGCTEMSSANSLLSDKSISEDKKQIVINLYESGIGVEFIAMQLDLEIPDVIRILREQNVYNE
jgi:uncharacterized protein YuzE